MDLKEMTIDKLGTGIIIEKFEDGLKEVLKNIFDLNTEANVAREVQVTLTIKPDNKREHCSYAVKMKPKLATHKAYNGTFFVGRKADEFEIYEHNPDQGNLFVDEVVEKENYDD